MEDYVCSEMQELLLALDELGKSFGCNRDLYYMLGDYLGYIKLSSFPLNSHKAILWPGFCALLVLRHRISLASFTILNITFTIMVTMMPLQILLKQTGHSSILSSSYWKSIL